MYQYEGRKPIIESYEDLEQAVKKEKHSSFGFFSCWHKEHPSLVVYHEVKIYYYDEGDRQSYYYSIPVIVGDIMVAESDDDFTRFATREQAIEKLKMILKALNFETAVPFGKEYFGPHSQRTIDFLTYNEPKQSVPTLRERKTDYTKPYMPHIYTLDINVETLAKEKNISLPSTFSNKSEIQLKLTVIKKESLRVHSYAKERDEATRAEFARNHPELFSLYLTEPEEKIIIQKEKNEDHSYIILHGVCPPYFESEEEEYWRELDACMREATILCLKEEFPELSEELFEDMAIQIFDENKRTTI